MASDTPRAFKRSPRQTPPPVSDASVASTSPSMVERMSVKTRGTRHAAATSSSPPLGEMGRLPAQWVISAHIREGTP